MAICTDFKGWCSTESNLVAMLAAESFHIPECSFSILIAKTSPLKCLAI